MFNVTQLNSQPGRYALIAEAVLPPLFLFLIAGWWLQTADTNDNDFHGKPTRGSMWFVWFLVVAMWCIALVIIGMDTDDELSLIMIGIFSFLGIFASYMFMWNMSYGYSMAAYGFAPNAAFNTIAQGVPTVSFGLLNQPELPNPERSRTTAVFWLVFAFLCMAGTSAITFGSITPSDSKIVAGLFFTLITGWLAVKTGYTYLAMNHNHVGPEKPVEPRQTTVPPRGK